MTAMGLIEWQNIQALFLSFIIFLNQYKILFFLFKINKF